MAELLSLKEHQDIMLRLMTEYHAFCVEHDLRYFLAYGTLIVAVRHKGFIPWDDDVDIVMPRPDYDRLIEFSKISSHTEIVTFHNTHGYYHPFTYANIIDTETIMVEHQIKRQTGKGVFLDVFPLDGLPENENRRQRHLKKLMFMQSLLSNGINVPPGFSTIKNCAKSVLGYLLCGVDKVKLAKKIEALAKLYPYEDSNDVVHAVALFKAPYRYITPKGDYETSILADFENQKFLIPCGFDTILKRSYGDYMILPPESEQSGHHGIDIYYRS